MGFSKLIKHKFNGGIKRVILLFYTDAFPQKGEKNNDPEGRMLRPYCKGVGADIGCGSRKTHPDAIGVDTTKKGVAGKYGSEKRKISEADICLPGDNLYLFADGVLDYIVSRHTIEHFQNPKKALREWKRVLKKNGTLGIITPDNDEVDALSLDPTHRYAFTKKSFKKLLDEVGGFRIIKLETCIPKWSFVCIAKKIK